MATTIPLVGRAEGRQPPQDLGAEASVLGACLLDPTAVTRILDFLTPEDFYRENHGQIYKAALSLFREGEPIDNVTVAAELEKLGVLERVGGRAQIALLQESVPTAANVEYYARIVKDRAYKRQLISAGAQVTALGYEDALDAEEAVNQAQSHVYAISDERVGSGLERLDTLLKPAMDRIDAQMAAGGGVVGIASGFHDLDRMTNGYKASDLIIVAGRPSMGKALALDTPIPTPTGWTTMGALVVGDQVFDDAGRPCTVTRTTPYMYGRCCYEVVFSDRSILVADADHLWATLDRSARKRKDGSLSVRTTAEVLASIRTTDGRANHLIPTCKPLQYPEQDLPVDPYVLGVWLGDGHSSSATITVSDIDAQILDEVRCAGVALKALRRSGSRTPMYRLGSGSRGGQRNASKLDWIAVQEVRARVAGGAPGRAVAASLGVSPAPVSMAVNYRTWVAEEDEPLQVKLRRLRVIGDKHIPSIYLQASIEQRLALLQGLMDSDGHVDRLGHAEFCCTNQRLAGGVTELVSGLGIVCFRADDRAKLAGVDMGPRYRVRFKTDLPVCRLRRKLARLQQVAPGKPSKSRRIDDIRPTPSVPVRCIQVDSPSSLYLAGRSCIPTHNTSFALNVALHAAVEQRKPVAIFSLEMSKEQLVERMLCEQARIDAQRLHRAMLSDVEYERLAGALGPLGDAPIFIDDSPLLDDLTLRLKARQAKTREGIEMIVLDYLQLMHGRGGGDDSNRVQEVSAISRALKSIARELRIPVMAISQLSRGPEARPDKRPILSDLRDSGCLTADTRLLRADTGAPVTIAELMEHGSEGVWLWSISDDRKLHAAPLVRIFQSGVKPVFRLRLATGRSVKASANHRFLTYDGWRRLDELGVGQRLAVPRRTPAPVKPVEWSKPRLTLLAHLIGDGCTLARQPIHYTSADEQNLEVVEESARSEFGIEPRRVRQGSWWHTYLPSPYRLTHGIRNPIAAWLSMLGVYGLRSYEKRIPDALFAAGDEDLAWFLRHLWATDGSVNESGVPGVYYATSSPRLAEDVALLLCRFGLITKTTVNLKAGTVRPTHQVWIRGVNQVRQFASQVGIHGRRGEKLDALFARLAGVQPNTNIDTVPLEVWADVRAEMDRTGTTARALAAAMGTAYNGSAVYGTAPSRHRLAGVATALGGSTLLEQFTCDDVFWDRVMAIEPLGEQPVYDGTVAGTHNFIADGVIAHNSIEQDADLVMFLYRDDYYLREKSEKPGLAEVIVAKHRNGPTGTVELVFRKELTRFENLDRRRSESSGAPPA